MMLRPRRSRAFAAGLVVILAGCSSSTHRHASATTASHAGSASSVTQPAHQLVVLGDSIADDTTYTCAGCTIFPDQLAHALGAALASSVSVVNLAVPDAQVNNLLHSVRTDEVYQSVIANSDAVLINIGHNDLAYNRIDDPCHVAPDYPRIAWQRLTHACLDRALATYRAELNAVLAEIERLRDGKPTMIRLTTVYNTVIGDRIDPTWDSPAAIAPSTYAVRHMVRAQCQVVEHHDGLCVDTYHLLNGKDGLRSAQPYLNPPDAVHLIKAGEDVVARALIALGYAPLATD